MMALLFGFNAIGANYRAIYDFEYTKDSINSIIEKDILYLEIAEKGSFCFSYHTYYSDSLWRRMAPMRLLFLINAARLW